MVLTNRLNQTTLKSSNKKLTQWHNGRLIKRQFAFKRHSERSRTQIDRDT